MKTLLAVLLVSIAVTANAEDQYLNTIMCDAKAVSFSSSGESPMDSDSRLFLVLAKDESGVIQVREFSGYVNIFVSYVEYTGVPDYAGIFSGKDLKQQVNYKPRRYTEHMKFADLNAGVTPVGEHGMWGDLILNKAAANLKYKEKTDAHYIMQAGDHLGGTLHFTCVKAGY